MRGLRQRDRSRQAFGRDDPAGVGGRDQPAEVDPYPLRHFPCQQCRGHQAKPPVDPGRDHRNHDHQRDSIGRRAWNACDTGQHPFDGRRARKCVPRHKHQHHLKGKGEQVENARIPCRGNLLRGRLGSEEEGQRGGQQGKHNRKHERVRHQPLKQKNKHRGKTAEH